MSCAKGLENTYEEGLLAKLVWICTGLIIYICKGVCRNLNDNFGDKNQKSMERKTSKILQS